MLPQTSCRGAEAVSHGPACLVDLEISQPLFEIDVPGVKYVSW